MNQNQLSASYKALDFVPLVDVPSGPGAHFMITMAVQSKVMDFLEGCLHAYFDGNTEFPGVLLATGTEDYFDSAYYFNGGQYHQPTTGFTHQDKVGGNFRWSAYRYFLRFFFWKAKLFLTDSMIKTLCSLRMASEWTGELVI